RSSSIISFRTENISVRFLTIICVAIKKTNGETRSISMGKTADQSASFSSLMDAIGLRNFISTDSDSMPRNVFSIAQKKSLLARSVAPRAKQQIGRVHV